VATNQMRREAAKRKLARQQERRAARARRRRQLTVISSAAAVVVVVGAVVALTMLSSGSNTPPAADAAATPSAAPAAETPPSIPTALAAVPQRATPLPATVSCAYPAQGHAAKPVKAPPTADVSARGTVGLTLRTSAGAIPLTLDRDLAPCTVNSMVSLAQQGYFDGTSCHRLTTQPGLQVLQCGDPSGSGTGGPGYTIPDEVAPGTTYGRGLLAMANTGQRNTGGSQFFMIYGDAQLPPQYTVFGTIGAPGLQVLDTVAKKGDDGSMNSSAGGGKPVEPVTITKAQVG
jgi:peptidyl-prolyl cis-trans isomerase B (cyclophilin B)